jgi:hypothetical protein
MSLLEAHLAQTYEQHLQRRLSQQWGWEADHQFSSRDIDRYPNTVSVVPLYQEPAASGKTTFVKSGTERRNSNSQRQSLPELILSKTKNYQPTSFSKKTKSFG